MSSCVIEKAAYMKAAGAVAGVADAYKNSHWREIFIYDYEAGHKMEAEDFRRRFARCFEMNCISVQEQYGDEEPFTDPDEHMDAFRAGYAIGKKSAYNDTEMKELIFNLQRFFDSCIYQVEKYAYMFDMKAFFYEIICSLLKTTDYEDNRVNKSFEMFEAGL